MTKIRDSFQIFRVKLWSPPCSLHSLRWQKRKHTRFDEIHFFTHYSFILVVTLRDVQKISTFRTRIFCKLGIIFKQRIFTACTGAYFLSVTIKREKIRPWRIEVDVSVTVFGQKILENYGFSNYRMLKWGLSTQQIGSFFVFLGGESSVSPGGLTMVWPEGTILKIQASRWSRITLEIDFS